MTDQGEGLITHTVVNGETGEATTHTETAVEHAECLARLHAPAEAAEDATDSPSPESSDP